MDGLEGGDHLLLSAFEHLAHTSRVPFHWSYTSDLNLITCVKLLGSSLLW